MSTISLRVSEGESLLIHSYVTANGLNISSFVRDLILDKIEEDLNLDNKRILKYYEFINKEKASEHTDVWERLGV